jgi:alpha-beta hydrolase superfamily lysophospholipase
MSARRPAVLGALLLLGALLAVGTVVGCSTYRAGRVLSDTLAGADAVADELVETLHQVPTRAGPLAVTVYRPRDAGAPLPAFLLVHGATIEGAADARFVALARAVAARGASVATPDLPALASLRLDAGEPARLADVALWLGERTELAADGRLALMGISVGGSYALLAAADARLAPRVRAVFVFGAYADLEALLLEWLTAPVATAELLDPSTEGRRRVLLGNLDALVEPAHRAAVAGAIDELLRGRTPPAPAGLGPRAARVLAAARSEQPLSPAAAEEILQPLVPALAALSPAAVGAIADAGAVGAVGVPAAPVFLLHAEADPVVPLAHGLALHELLVARGAEVRLHVTGIFAHVDPGHRPSFFEAFPLLRFFGAFLDAAGL